MKECEEQLEQFGSDLDAAQQYLRTLADNVHVAPGWVDSGAGNSTLQTIVSPALQARMLEARRSNPETHIFY